MKRNSDHHFLLSDAQEYLNQHSTAALIVHRALTDTRVAASRHRNLCTQAAAYLYANGLMDELHATRCGYVSDTELAKINAKLAYRQLQSVGIAPSFFILSWIARHVLIPFLINLFLRHAMESWGE